MLSKISRFVTIAALTTLTCIITNPSEAQNIQSNETPSSGDMIVIEPSNPLNVSELVNQAFSEYGGDFFEQATIEGSLNTIFGWRSFPQGSFPENDITKDGLLLSIMMSDYFNRLQKGETIIRTRDLSNPFDTSLEENPDYTNYTR
jgi:hypothetical protein